MTGKVAVIQRLERFVLRLGKLARSNTAPPHEEAERQAAKASGFFGVVGEVFVFADQRDEGLRGARQAAIAAVDQT